MGGKKRVDLEAKLFDPEKRGCMAVLVGPRKVGEIDYEVLADGNVRVKVGLRGARTDGASGRATVLVNGEPVAEVEVERGRGFLRLDTSRGDSVPRVELGNRAEVQYGGTVVGEGEFRRD